MSYKHVSGPVSGTAYAVEVDALEVGICDSFAGCRDVDNLGMPGL